MAAREDDNSKQARDPRKEAEEIWLECLNDWYPNRHKQTYFLPPLHFMCHYCESRKLHCGKKIEILRKPYSHDLRDDSDAGVNCVSGTELFENVRKKSGTKKYTSDFSDDDAQERVLFCLQELFKVRQEPMMVISQLKFGEYLNKPTYAAAVKSLPTPRELNDHKVGDFDVLIIHKKYGLITGEVKSVSNWSSVGSRVDEAVEQLCKAETVLTHLVSDLQEQSSPNLNILKTVILPNITPKELDECLKKHEQTAKGLRECLGAQNDSACIAMCLCDLVVRKTLDENRSEELKRLGNWWDQLISSRRFQGEISNTIYDRLLARFCGPATTIRVHCVQTPRLEVRTKGDGVSETGERIAMFVLFPEQVELLKLHPFVFLSGPPGTGKTVLLIITGLLWLQKGFDVYVVSTSSKSRAASYVIEHQLKETFKEWRKQDVSKVNLHRFDLTVKTEVNSAVECLVKASKGQGLSLLVDEINEDIKDNISDFCRSLKSKVSFLQIWTASFYHNANPSNSYLEFAHEKLTLPLRSPHTVIEEVKKAAEIVKFEEVLDYKESGFPTSTKGPQVERIKTHHEGQSGHTGSGPLNCVECGRLIAKFLTELHVGETITISISPKEASKRWPSVVIRVVEKAVEIDKHNDVPNLKESGSPKSTDSPQIQQITHHEGQSGHTGSAPLNCIECRRLIAQLLKKLHGDKTITISISSKEASTRTQPANVGGEEKAVEIDKHNDVPNLKESGSPKSTDSPQIEQITHYEGQSGHTGRQPLNCVECGRLIANSLTEHHVGETVTISIFPQEDRPPPLQYRDVLILCYDYPKDDRTGIIRSKADGLVQGLREVYVNHVRVVENSGDDNAIRDTALALTDKISVTHWDDVHGIERKVVVVLAENGRLSDVYHRLRSASRSMSQLVWVGLEKLA